MAYQPRIRSIKPELWRHEKLGKCSPQARLLFLGLISHADDEGIEPGNNQLIKSLIFPFEKKTRVNNWLDELEEIELIYRYNGLDGTEYIYLPTFTHNQYIDRPTPTLYPKPDCFIVRDAAQKGRRNKQVHSPNDRRMIGDPHASQSPTGSVSVSVSVSDQDQLIKTNNRHARLKTSERADINQSSQSPLKSERPGWQEILWLFDRYYRDHYGDTPPTIDWSGKDRVMAIKMRKAHSRDALEIAIANYMGSKDKWVVERAHSLRSFWSSIDQWTGNVKDRERDLRDLRDRDHENAYREDGEHNLLSREEGTDNAE